MFTKILFVVHGALNSIITLKVISIPANCINWRITKSGGKYMSHFAYACKMRCPLNLVLENSEYLWFY